MKPLKPSSTASSAKTTSVAGDDLHSAVLDFIRRGRRAQEAVDRILATEPERRRTPGPKGHA